MAFAPFNGPSLAVEANMVRPSAAEHKPTQLVIGAAAVFQFVAPSVEKQIGPGRPLAMPAATAHLVPSAEHAMEDQSVPGTELDVHDLPRSDEAYSAPLPEMATMREASPEQAMPDQPGPGLCDGSGVGRAQVSPLFVET